MACDDGDPCTLDSCSADNLCVLDAIPGCCDELSDCDDGDPCTLDLCVGGQCATVPNPACCEADSDCVDDNPCTADACLSFGGIGFCDNPPLGGPGCCLADEHCPALPCEAVTCSDFQCLYVPAPQDGCCDVDAECDDGNACTVDTCDLASGTCASEIPPEGCCAPATYATFDFDDGTPDGFEVIDDGSHAHWLPSPARTTSEPWSLYYGMLETLDYDTGKRTFGTATSPELTVPAGHEHPTLVFSTYLDIEPVELRDDFNVRLFFGSSLLEVWNKTELTPDQFQSWQQVHIPLPPDVVGHPIRIQLNFDSIDGLNNDGEGIYVDDIEVLNLCP